MPVVIQVTLRYFGITQEVCGKASESMELSVNTPLMTLVEALHTRYSLLAQQKSSLRYAVNRKLVSMDTILQEGDEIALLPPIAGG